MDIKKILFIGLGGAGQRHLRILKKLLPDSVVFSAYRHTSKTPFLRSDFTVDETKNLVDEYGLKVFNDLEGAFNSKPSITVISTPTAYHKEFLMLAVKANSGIIIEKPWAENLNGFKDFKSEVIKRKLPFLISFQRRYNPLITLTKRIIENKEIGTPMTASFTIFSDVESWHSYENWRELYAVKKELGGGVLLTEIHEIDLIYWFFGLPQTIYCVGGNRGSVKLDVEDTAQLILEYDNLSVSVSMCFVNKNKARNFNIIGDNGSIEWNETENNLKVYNNNRKTDIYLEKDLTNDKLFFDQAYKFINNWTLEDSKNSLESAGNSLAIVIAAKKSLLSGQVEIIKDSF